MDAFADDYDIAVALDRLSNFVTLPVERVMHSWAGLRTFAPDRYPVLGEHPDHPGFFWLAGQGGFGVQTSPELGQQAASAILRGTPLDAAIHVNRLLA